MVTIRVGWLLTALEAFKKKKIIGSGQPTNNSRHTTKVREPLWQCLRRLSSKLQGRQWENQIRDLTEGSRTAKETECTAPTGLLYQSQDPDRKRVRLKDLEETSVRMNLRILNLQLHLNTPGQQKQPSPLAEISTTIKYLKDTGMVVLLG